MKRTNTLLALTTTAVLFAGQLEHEIHWKTRRIIADRLVQMLGFHAVYRRQIFIEHHALAADDMNQTADFR